MKIETHTLVCLKVSFLIFCSVCELLFSTLFCDKGVVHIFPTPMPPKPILDSSRIVEEQKLKATLHSQQTLIRYHLKTVQGKKQNFLRDHELLGVNNPFCLLPPSYFTAV